MIYFNSQFNTWQDRAKEAEKRLGQIQEQLHGLSLSEVLRLPDPLPVLIEFFFQSLFYE